MGWKEFAMNEYKKDDMIDGLETPSSEQSGPLAYQKPILISYGDVRDITLGSSFGEGESGCEAIFKPGAGGCTP